MRGARTQLQVMPHGRNHEQREQHIRLRRTRSTPESDAWETRLFTSGRQRGAPPEGVVGAHAGRRVPTHELATSRDRDEEPVGAGAEVAPTEKATRRERERHVRERALGRVAAGTEGKLRDERRPDLSRAGLEEAARAADHFVGASPRPRRSPRR
jgi:hypothetical protein